MQLLATFDLDDDNRLFATLSNVETNSPVAVVTEDLKDGRTFQDQVKAFAANLGHEIAEWDRSRVP